MIIRSLALLVAVLFHLAAAEPAPAVITKLVAGSGEGSAFPKAFVLGETLEGIEFTVDDPRSQSKLSLKRGSYAVEYRQDVDTSFLTGLNRQNDGKLDAAYTAYSKALKESVYPWVREESALRAAEVAVALKKPAEALAALGELEKIAPQSKHLPAALLLKGEVLLGTGDSAAAKVVFGELKSKGKAWGFAAEIAGVRGEASLARAAKDPASAAEILKPLFARLDPATQAADFGQVGGELAADLASAGKTAEAIAVYTRTAYGASDPTAQARAHLGWAMQLAKDADTKSLERAFDRAATACLVKGADDSVTGSARTLALQLASKLDKAADLSAEDKREYRTYATKL